MARDRYASVAASILRTSFVAYVVQQSASVPVELLLGGTENLTSLLVKNKGRGLHYFSPWIKASIQYIFLHLTISLSSQSPVWINTDVTTGFLNAQLPIAAPPATAEQ